VPESSPDSDGLSVAPPLDSRIFDGSPVRACVLLREEFCHRVLLVTKRRDRPWEWAVRCVAPGGESTRGNAVLHSHAIDYAAYGAEDPASLLPPAATPEASASTPSSVRSIAAIPFGISAVLSAGPKRDRGN